MPRASLVLAALAVALLTAGVAAAADKVQIGVGKVAPESMTATADGTLYAGSIMMGEVFKAPPGSKQASPFIQKQPDGPQNILGVYADEKAGLLWVCYSDMATFSGKGQPAVLRNYDLRSGAVGQSYSMAAGSFCNDITTAADGTAYAADTSGGKVMRLRPGAAALEVWYAAPELAGIDGISIGPDGALYVNSYNTGKLYRIEVGADGSAGKLTELKLSQPLKGADGMRFGDDGVLYLAENNGGEVDAVSINGDTATVKPTATGLDAPTALSKVGTTLWVLEAKIDKMADPSEMGPYYMIPFPLGK